MLRKLGREIGLFEPLVEFWKQHKELGPLLRLMEALREVALSDTEEVSSQKTEGRRGNEESRRAGNEESIENRKSKIENPLTSSSLVVFVDEIDFVRSLPFSA